MTDSLAPDATATPAATASGDAHAHAHASADASASASAAADLRARAEAAVCELLPRVLKYEVTEPVTAGAALVDDLGLTSGGTLELILELEDHLDIQIDVEEIQPEDLRTVAGLAAYVAAHVVAED